MPDPAPKTGGSATDDDRHDDDREGSRRSGRGPTDEGRGVARRMLDRFRGKAEDVIAQMADEAKELREDRRVLREKLKGFEGTDVRVLRGDELKEFTEFKALGKKPADIKTELELLPGLRTKVSDTERIESARLAAPHVGWNADTFAAMVKDKGLEVSLVDAKDKDGKDIKVPHVRPAGAAAEVKPVAAADWVNSNASYMKVALETKPTTSTTTTQQQTQRIGTQFVEQATTQTPNGQTSGAPAAKAAVPGMRTYVLPSQRNAAADKK